MLGATLRRLGTSLRAACARARDAVRTARREGLTARQKRIFKVFGVLGTAIVILCVLIALVMGALVANSAFVKEIVEHNTALAAVVFALVNALQVVAGLIPGEPLELLGGYLFGTWGGLAVVSAGIALGEVAVFLAVKRHGMQLVSLLVNKDKLDELAFFNDPRRLNVVAFLMMLIPGTPKNIVVYVVGLTPMNLGTWMLISVPARAFSILCSTIVGAQAAADHWFVAASFFALAMLISAFGVAYYVMISRQARASAVLDEVARAEWEDAGRQTNDAEETTDAAVDADTQATLYRPVKPVIRLTAHKVATRYRSDRDNGASAKQSRTGRFGTTAPR